MGKRPDEKDTVTSKSLSLQPGEQIITIHILSSISRMEYIV